MYMPSALLLTWVSECIDVAEVLAALHYMHRGVSNTEQKQDTQMQITAVCNVNTGNELADEVIKIQPIEMQFRSIVWIMPNARCMTDAM